MHSGIPYFSNLNIHKKGLTSTAPVYSALKPQYTPAALGLGLPTRQRSTYQPAKSYLAEIFPDTQTKTPGLLATAETSAVIDRQFAEVNKTKFLDLASAETVKNFSKLAQNASTRFNPLKSQPAGPKSKRRKPDIFD
jgi:hypothetical protein